MDGVRCKLLAVWKTGRQAGGGGAVIIVESGGPSGEVEER